MGAIATKGRPGHHTVLTPWNPLAPDQLADQGYEMFALARREAPVFYNDFFGGWVVTTYDLVFEVVKDTAHFSNGAALGPTDVPKEVDAKLPYGFIWAYPSLENNDPPNHTRIRKLANDAFKQGAIRTKESEIREIAARALKRFSEKGEGDFVSAFADPFPGLVMCNILGIDDEHAEQVVAWSDSTLAMQNPALPPEERVNLAQQQVEFYEFCEGFVAERRAEPRDDAMSRMILARVDGEEALTDPELTSTFSHFLLGGNETTRRLLASMILLLVEHPEQLAAVVADPTLSIRAVEETLRYLTPVKGLYRNTIEDAEIDGVRIGAGDLVVPMWGSGNRDETKFDRAEEFDIFRPESEKHMAFSRYAHFCLGAPLARLEATMALELAVELLPKVRRADDEPLDWLPMPMHSGLSGLRLAWDA